MHKLKRGERPPIRWLYVLLALGIIALAGISVWGVWQLRVGLNTPPTLVPTDIVIVYPTAPPLFPTPYPTLTPTAVVQRFTGSMVFGGEDGRLGMIDDGSKVIFTPNVLVDTVSASPNQKLIGYIRNGHLHLYIPNEGEQVVEVAGQMRFMAWSPDSKALTFVARSANGDALYRLPLKTMTPLLQLTVVEIIAPPVWHPSMSRLLIAEPGLTERNTTLYTIDANCVSPGECNQSRQDFATLPYWINWLDYQPSGLYMVAADGDSGRLYLISTAKKDSMPVPESNGGEFKQRPVFNRDGNQIAFVSAAKQVFVLDLRDMSVQRIVLNNDADFRANSISWR